MNYDERVKAIYEWIIGDSVEETEPSAEGFERPLRIWAGHCAFACMNDVQMDVLTMNLAVHVLSWVTDVRVTEVSEKSISIAVDLFARSEELAKDHNDVLTPTVRTEVQRLVDTLSCVVLAAGNTTPWHCAKARNVFFKASGVIPPGKAVYLVGLKNVLFTLLSGEARVMKAKENDKEQTQP